MLPLAPVIGGISHKWCQLLARRVWCHTVAFVRHTITWRRAFIIQLSPKLWKKLMSFPAKIHSHVPKWVPSRADRTQMRPMLSQWTLLSGYATRVYMKMRKRTINLNQKENIVSYFRRQHPSFDEICFTLLLQYYPSKAACQDAWQEPFMSHGWWPTKW